VGYLRGARLSSLAEDPHAGFRPDTGPYRSRSCLGSRRPRTQPDQARRLLKGARLRSDLYLRCSSHTGRHRLYNPAIPRHGQRQSVPDASGGVSVHAGDAAGVAPARSLAVSRRSKDAEMRRRSPIDRGGPSARSAMWHRQQTPISPPLASFPHVDQPSPRVLPHAAGLSYPNVPRRPHHQRSGNDREQAAEREHAVAHRPSQRQRAPLETCAGLLCDHGSVVSRSVKSGA